MGWKKLEARNPGRPCAFGASIIIYPKTNTMYASKVLRDVADRVEFEICEERQLLRITPSDAGVDIHCGRFNFRPLRQMFNGIEKNVVIHLVETDGHYIGRIQ